MTRDNLILDLHDELFVDNFAGGGGASTGIERALGRQVDHAINHDQFALGMHRINHPQTIHHCEDVFDVDPASVTEGRPVGAGWFSPDCKHFSKAKGGKPLSKKIRGLAFVILRWAKIHTRVIYMENVEEIQTWGPLLHHPRHRVDCDCGKPCGKADPQHKGRTWQAFLAALGSGVAPDSPDIPEMLEVLNSSKPGMSISREELIRGFGYQCETRELRACDYGAPTIRRRLFLIARCDGLPIVWPEPTHFSPKEMPVARRRLGRSAKPWIPVSTCIDWDIPCHSIFLTAPEAKRMKVNVRRPLAKSTLRRIAAGIDRYVLKAAKPFLVSLTHQGGDDRVESTDRPAKTLTGAHRGEKALVSPTLMVNTTHHTGSSVGEPSPTIPTGGHHAIVNSKLAPFLTEHANASNQRNVGVDKPMPTQCAEVKGGHFAVVAGTMVQTGYGENVNQKPRSLDVEKPLGTIVSGGKHAVVAAHMIQKGHLKSNSKMIKGADEPMRCQVSRSEHGIVAAHLTKFTTGSVGQSPDKPLPVVAAGSHSPDTHGGAASVHGLVAANMVKFRGTPETHPPAKDATKPLDTVSSAGLHHGVCAAYLAQHNAGFNQTPGHEATDPASTISAKGSQQQLVASNLVAYYGNDKEGQASDDPARTVTVRERFGFVESELVSPLTPEQIAGARRVAEFLRAHGVEFEGEFAILTVDGVQFVIVDIGMRMLTARELFRAQGFGDDYIIDLAWVIDPKTGDTTEIHLTKEQQIRMCGNSVCPPIAEALVRANSSDLAVWRLSETKSKSRRPSAALVN